VGLIGSIKLVVGLGQTEGGGGITGFVGREWHGREALSGWWGQGKQKVVAESRASVEGSGVGER
jgi:hypothetical protein